MQPQSRRLLAVAAVLAAGLVVYLLVSAAPPSDQVQIGRQIAGIQDAAQRKSTSGVMQYVSEDYRDQTISNPDQLSLLLSHRLFASSDPLAVDVENTSITVTGDTASSISHVRLVSGAAPIFDGNITLHWKREPSHRYLFFPDHTWRVTGSEAPGDLEQGD
jgi:ketosteroid isomerase-like protein